jgi:hypothetical protein
MEGEEGDDFGGERLSGRLESSTITSLGRSAVPSLSSSQSGSVGLRSQRRERGPVASSNRLAASGRSRRRAVRSAANARRASRSTRALRARYSVRSWRYDVLPSRLLWKYWPTYMRGVSRPNRSMVGWRMITARATEPIIGNVIISRGKVCRCGFCGSVGRAKSVIRGGGNSRGGRLKSRVPPVGLGDNEASGGCISAKVSTTGPTVNWTPGAQVVPAQRLVDSTGRRSSSSSFGRAAGSTVAVASSSPVSSGMTIGPADGSIGRSRPADSPWSLRC